VLYAAAFVARRREGVSVFYRLADPDVLALCDLVCGRIERELAEQRRALR
jgi:ArsR family transcriptional regulator